MPRSLLLTLLALSLALSSVTAAEPPPVELSDTKPSSENDETPSELVQIYFCHFEVPSFIKNQNYTFSIFFKFDVDSLGVPTNIEKIKSEHVEESSVFECLGAWRLPNVEEGSEIAVAFHWKHARGWVEMIVVGGGLDQSVKMYGNPSPYSKH